MTDATPGRERDASTDAPLLTELARGFRLLADACEALAAPQEHMVDSAWHAGEAFSKVLTAVPRGSGFDERILALLGRAAACVVDENLFVADNDAAAALDELQTWAFTLDDGDDSDA